MDISLKIVVGLMKLRNKKTGEIIDDVQYRNYSLPDGFGLCMNGKNWEYHSLAELNEEWEDATEEPKEYWYYNTMTNKVSTNYVDSPDAQEDKEIGNYFETRKEAKEAVEKLKSWKRLKDKGFRFDGYDVAHKSNGDLTGQIFYDGGDYSIDDVDKEMDLLFGGEE